MSPRILVTRTDRIGDVVLSTPVFSAIRRRYPAAHIAAMIAASNRDLVEGNPYLDDIILYDKRGPHASWAATFRFGRALRARRFDTVINLHANNRAHWISYLAGIPKRIGYRRKNAFLLTHAIADKKKLGERHESEYNFDLLKFIDVPLSRPHDLFLPLLDKHKAALEERLSREGTALDRPYVVIHPSASCPSRLWKAERYARVADRLVERWGVDIVLVAGGGSDRIFTERVRSFMRTEPIDLAGKLTLGMLSWVLKGARLLLSNDSGPVHMAAALDVCVIAIFGRNQLGLSPRRWRPLGEKSSYIQKDVGCIECAAHNCNLGFLCLDEVTVDHVLDRVETYEARFVG